MESNNTTPPADPANQTLFILTADGRPMPVNTLDITDAYRDASSISILYGTQIGACIMMLTVVLVMTPKFRLRQAPTIISILALSLNIIRMVLLAIFFVSPFMNVYALFTGDYERIVSAIDMSNSVAATTMSIPMTMLILAALFFQAWSMIRLWPGIYKIPLTSLSLILVLMAVVFNFLTTTQQAQAQLHTVNLKQEVWVRKMYLALITASICWFCFLFNIRLVMHMWTNRSILPSLKGLKAMDVLVITNGILMFIPALFSVLEWAHFTHFEVASLTQTSVVLVLPLGTLVAQRLANPHLFGSTLSPGGGGGGCHNDDHDGPAAGLVLNPNNTNSSDTTSSFVSRGGGFSATMAKRPLLKSASPRRDNVKEDGGVHSGVYGKVVLTHIASIDAGGRRGVDASAGFGMGEEKGRAGHHDWVVDMGMDGEKLVDLETGNGIIRGEGP
ncbi:hypothetical protein VTI74DRAFT_7068 [Chaetomium olivicolor]